MNIKKLATVLLMAALMLSVAACGQTEEPAQAEPEAAEQTVEHVIFTESVRGYYWAPAYLAETLGYYEEEGIEAEFQTVTGMDATAPVLSGDAQFCLKGIESALMVNEAGQGCKVVVSTTQKYPYQLIGANETYNSLESLKGGTVAGGQSPTSGPYSFAMACVNAAGMVPQEDVSVITMLSSGYAAAIENGDIQAAIGSNPWVSKKLVDAGGVVIADGTDEEVIADLIGSSSYELFTIMTSDEYIASNPETVQKVVNAIARAIDWMQNATAEEVAEMLLPMFEGADEEVLYDAQYDKDRGVSTENGYHTESGYQAALALTKLAGGISGDLAVEDIFDESFLDNAWAN